MAEAAALKEEGNAKFKAGQFAAAVEAYTKSLELDPAQHLCLSNRSAAYLKDGAAAEALRDAERCVELSPGFAKGYSRQAAALQELRRWDEAAKVCERGMAAAPDDVHQKMLKEVRNRAFQEKIQGVWRGTVSKDLGGYDQEMEFMAAGKVRIEVLGRSVIGDYWLDCDQDPHHLNVQVPMPEAPPGMPPPPPVPYIVRVDDAGLHMCCPFMVMDRPTSFSGEGYCLMHRGNKVDSDEAEKISRLSEDEKLLQCVLDLTEALPDMKLQEVTPADSQEVTREKLMLQVRFETSMFAVEKKFGEEIMRKSLGAAKGDTGVPACLAKTPELKRLREKLSVCGLLEEGKGAATEQAPPAAVAPPAPADRAAGSPAAAPRPSGSGGTGDTGEDKPAAAASGGGYELAAAAVLAAGAVAVVLGALAWQRRRR